MGRCYRILVYKSRFINEIHGKLAESHHSTSKHPVKKVIPLLLCNIPADSTAGSVI